MATVPTTQHLHTGEQEEDDEEEFSHFPEHNTSDDSDRSTIAARRSKLETHESVSSESGWKGLTKRIFSKRGFDNTLNLNDSQLTVLKKGWLFKQGFKRKNWKRRWFVLTDGWLGYFPNETEKNALGVMHLECELIYPSSGFSKDTLTLVFPERHFFIQPDNPEEFSSWLTAIKEAISWASRGSFKSLEESKNETESNVVSTTTATTTPAPAPPPPPPPPPAQVSSEVWQEEDDSLDLEFQTSDMDGLIKRLTLPTKNSASFVKEFLLTYRIYLEPLQLLMLLQDRFWIEPDEELDENQKNCYKETKQFPIRLRVNNVIRTWFDMSPKDFDNELISECLNFFTQQEQEYQADLLMKSILPVKKAMSKKVMGLSTFEDPPDLMTMANDADYGSFTLFSFDDLEIATHLMYFEHVLFCRITSNQFLRGAWYGKDKYLKAKDIVDMIEHFNKVSTWISMLILNESSLEIRRQSICRVIGIGEACLQVQNFNALKEIISGLTTPAVSRLKTTWQGIPSSKLAKFKVLQKLTSDEKGHEGLREKMGESQPPIMPFLGMYLHDFSAVDEGSTDYVNGQINFDKCRKIARIAMNIITLQKAIPTLESPNMRLLKLLTKIPQGSKDLTMALTLSKRLEP